MHSVEWRFLPFEDTVQMVPFVDDQALTELVTEFERSHRLKPSGGYAGLVLIECRLGDLRQYLRGKQQRDRVTLLGCECGEMRCWPLDAVVRRDGKTVTWTDFQQPFGKNRDYSEFGPFTFDLQQYMAAVEAAAASSG